MPILSTLQEFALEPQNHEFLSILKGFRNGLVYGTKIRFPHALVMTFLFRSGSFQEKAKAIFKATKAHARNLAFFVTIYKTMMFLQKRIQGKELNHHSFVAGLLGGYLIFGDNNNVNNQIVLYLFSRIIIGLAKLTVKRQVIEEPQHSFPVFAAVVWGIVMWLFRHDRDTLQPSLQASMQYLYIDSNKWNSLKNLIWHNK
ncbi:hypothetical protein K7432_012738 [Basidiobolus ranarum]|uniref:Peroxisomal membrane protein 4 n=1 Tax=Basidiobolus ranarum TaxID=34480 RepID=A0ABR2WKA7_9FUNG